MPETIDEFLQEFRFEIYNNEEVMQEDIEILVKEFCKISTENLKKYFFRPKKFIIIFSIGIFNCNIYA